MPAQFELTDEIVASSICPDNKHYIVVWDSLVTGFGLRVMPTGKKNFILQARDAKGKSFNKRLGQPDDAVNPINTERARAKAVELLKPIQAEKLGDYVPQKDKSSMLSVSDALSRLSSYLIQMQPHANDEETAQLFSANAQLAREFSCLLDLASQLQQGEEPDLNQLLDKLATHKRALKYVVDPNKPSWKVHNVTVNDLTSQKFGRLLVLRRAPNKPGDANVRWICRCECGSETTVVGFNLKRGNTKSCGCLRKDGDHLWDRVTK